MLIDRYLIREITKPLVVIFAVLASIFAGYTTARYLADAANGLLPARTILYLIALKVVIAMEVLLPVTLYLSVVAALGRLDSDSEMTALYASGIGPSRVLRAVFAVSLLLAVLVGNLSLYVRPLAYEKSYWARAEAEAEFDIAGLKAGSFYEGGQGDRIIFVERIDDVRSRAEGVFVQSEHPGRQSITYAREAYQRLDEKTGEWILVFLDGHAYEISRTGDIDLLVEYKEFTLRLLPKEITPPEYKRKAAPTLQLARSSHPGDISELQWRLSTPLSTVLLGLLGVPLSRSAPRKGRYAKVFLAVAIYMVYYNLLAVAKTWVERGAVGSVPGIWWVDALLAAALLVLLSQPATGFRRWRTGVRGS